MTRVWNKSATVLYAAMAVLGLLLGGAAVAQDAGDGESAMVVGTFNPGAVYQAQDEAKSINTRAQQIQQQAQQAQQAGDQQGLQQAQQAYGQLQQQQQQLAQRLTNAIQNVVADVAEKEDVDVVARDLLYTGNGVDAKDITQTLISELEAAGGLPPLSAPGAGSPQPQGGGGQ